MDEKVRKKKSKGERSKDFMNVPANDEKDLGHGLTVESDIEKKRKHKDNKNKCTTDEMLHLNKMVEKNGTGGQDCSGEGDVTFVRNGEENNKSKRKKRKKGKDNDEIIYGINGGDNELQFSDDKKERKKKKRKNHNDSIPEMQEGFALESRIENNEGPNTHSAVTNNDDEGEKIKEKKKKKKKKKAKEKEKLTSKGKIIEDNELRTNSGDQASAENHESNPQVTEINMGDAIEHASSTKGDDQDKKKRKKKNKEHKRVTFSDQVEVFNNGLVQGKRFTKEEDQKIMEAMYNYVDAHGLGDHDQGVDMILHCSSYPKLKGCWKEIASALPHRPPASVYHRGHILFERDESRKWTPEDLEIIRKFHEKHGPNWRMLADATGKHRLHIKDSWRRIKLANVKKGHWSQDEYQRLFNLVNADLSLRALEETRKYKYGMLRDNICWEAIGNKLATRTSQNCCLKWYDQLSSPLVAKGEWEDTDDYRLLNALYALDACSMEEVEWDHLLEHRSGDVCRKRWKQMAQNIGEHGLKSFAEQVEILSERYRPDLVEAREAFDSKPLVP